MRNVVPSVVEFCEQVDRELYHVSPATARNHDSYRGALRRGALGKLSLAGITDADVAQFVRARISDGLATGYINKLLGYLRSRLATAQNRGLLQHMPNVKPLRHQRKDVDPFNPVELGRILYAAEKRGNWVEPYIYLLAFTGLRPCEACALTWDDLNGDTVRVNKRLDRRGHEGPVKTRHGVRMVPLAPRLRDRLPQRVGRIFPMQAYRADDWWPQLLAAANVPYRPIYQLRHTFASRALELGASVREVAGWLGHGSIRHVCDVYSQWAKTSTTSPVFAKMVEEVK